MEELKADIPKINSKHWSAEELQLLAPAQLLVLVKQGQNNINVVFLGLIMTACLWVGLWSSNPHHT